MRTGRSYVVFTIVAIAAVAGFVIGAGLPASDTTSSETVQPSASDSASAPGDPSSPAPAESSAPPEQPDVDRPPFEVTKLAPGQRPPQFVVVSFDGAGDHGLFQHYLNLADETDSRFTFFLSGIYLLPEEQRTTYLPPGRAPGKAAIGFTDAASVALRVQDLRQAYEQGHEVGTHFNGHFCGADGVASWSSADWRSEMQQANTFLTSWPTYLGTPEAEPLPFGPDDIIGGRTPCLEGDREAMRPVFAEFGFRYDASDTGQLKWPVKVAEGFWQFPLQRVAIAGTDKATLTMDYNFYFSQSGAKPVEGEQARAFEQQTYQSYIDVYNAVFNGNRAPLFIGNHFNTWNDSAYKNSLTNFIRDVCTKQDTQCISNEDLADWLDAQDPAVLAALQALPAQAQ